MTRSVVSEEWSATFSPWTDAEPLVANTPMVKGEDRIRRSLVPSLLGARKHSKVAGRANVLIFPDLNSGNIASKLVQHVARANAYGQILLGLDRPAADVSRGSNAHDILGVAAITGVQSIAYQLLFPEAGRMLPGEEGR